MYTVLEKGGVCSPKGFTAAGICAGIKASGNADMALLKSEKAARCFAVFTTNKVKAAPVLYDKAALEHAHFASAVIVNSGNANACTGEQGYKDAERMAGWAVSKHWSGAVKELLDGLRNVSASKQEDYIRDFVQDHAELITAIRQWNSVKWLTTKAGKLKKAKLKKVFEGYESVLNEKSQAA